MTSQRRDEGSILPMVLVLLVIGSLIVLPLLDYTIAVFRSNHVVSDRTAQSEAAKGGLRMALEDPRNVFLVCDGGGNLTPPDPVINGIAVSTTCSEQDEYGPNEALGFNVPSPAVAMQLGANVPPSFSHGGKDEQSAPVPPYPATADWWAGNQSVTAETDMIWTPNLPKLPPAARTSTAFDMPPAFACKVFFPGYYPNPLVVPQGRVYFASGVYYFEDVVTIEGDSDVVVGYGLEDFAPASDCADDIQVAANVTTSPGTFDIHGGGATWVFGGEGKLVIDNSATTTELSVRFNQRYDNEDRGGRISIMTVNGDDVVDGPHEVTNVSSVPQSQVLNDTSTLPLAGSGYMPSSSTFTDKARLPERPDNMTVDAFYAPIPGPNNGVLVVTWDEMTGQAAGGALLGERDTAGNWITSPYEVDFQRLSDGFQPGCTASELIVRPKPVPTDGNTVTCVLTGIEEFRNYDVRVRAVNEVGFGPRRRVDDVRVNSSSPLTAAPDAPTNVTVVDGATDDTAQVSWDAPTTTGGLPITGYDVTVSKVAYLPTANVAPVAPPLSSEWLQVETPLPASADEVVTAQLRAYDPNGDDLTLVINTGALPAPDVTAVANDADDTVTVTVTKFAPAGIYAIPYTVTDPAGLVATGELLVDVVPPGGATSHTIFAEPVNLLADAGVPITSRMNVMDEDGLPFGSTPVTVDTSGLDSDWTVTVSGLYVTITTTAPDGTYTIPYTAHGRYGWTDTSTIDVTVSTSIDIQPAGSCSVAGDPELFMPTVCEVPGLPDLTLGVPYGDQGYMTEVVAVTAAGDSVPAPGPAPLPLAFNGTGVGLLPPPLRIVEPWVPQPVIDVRAAGSVPTTVAIAGYVATPMGRLSIDNPNGHALKINGGVMSGTFDVNDSRATGSEGSLPYGFKNDIVLQRKVKIVSVAKNVTSTAIVQVNEDGAGYAVNEWIVG